MTRVKAVVYEANPHGHRLHFAALIMDALTEMDIESILVLPKFLHGSLDESIFLKRHRRRTRYIDGCNRIPSYAKMAKASCDIEQYYHPHRLYLPTGDGPVQFMGLAGPILRRSFREATEAVIFRGTFAYTTNTPLQRLKSTASQKLVHRAGLKAIHRVDPISHFAIPEKIRISRRERLLPEPIDITDPLISRNDARKQLSWEKDLQYLVSLGEVNSRKGIDKLLLALGRANLPKTFRLVLAGPHSGQIKQLVHTLPKPKKQLVLSIDKVVPEPQFSHMLCASDWVAVAYPQHIGSSGILLRANAARRPVIAGDYGWVGWATDTFNLGRTCDPNCTDELTHTLECMANNGLEFVETNANRSLYRYHTPSNFKHHITLSLKRHLEIPEPDALLNWDTVTNNLPSTTCQAR